MYLLRNRTINLFSRKLKLYKLKKNKLSKIPKIYLSPDNDIKINILYDNSFLIALVNN